MAGQLDTPVCQAKNMRTWEKVALLIRENSRVFRFPELHRSRERTTLPWGWLEEREEGEERGHVKIKKCQKREPEGQENPIEKRRNMKKSLFQKNLVIRQRTPGWRKSSETLKRKLQQPQERVCWEEKEWTNTEDLPGNRKPGRRGGQKYNYEERGWGTNPRWHCFCKKFPHGGVVKGGEVEKAPSQNSLGEKQILPTQSGKGEVRFSVGTLMAYNCTTSKQKKLGGGERGKEGTREVPLSWKNETKDVTGTLTGCRYHHDVYGEGRLAGLFGQDR